MKFCLAITMYLLMSAFAYGGCAYPETARCETLTLQQKYKYCFWCGETNPIDATKYKRCGHSF